MSEFENEHQRYEHGVLAHDFLPMSEEAIALRALIDHLGTAFPQPDLSDQAGVENVSVDDAA